MTQRITSWVLSYTKGLLESSLLSPFASQTPASSVTQHLPPSRCYIQTLPLELLGETFKYLGWRELLNASATCRTWRRASKSRQLWLYLANDLESSLDISPMEEPMTEYTVNELRHWVLQRLQAREIWNTPSAPLSFKGRAMELDHLQYAILLPGGRWLLATDLSGRLYSYDLDASDPTPQILVGPAPDEPTPTQGPNEISYWVDLSKKRLSFRVALWDGISPEENDHSLISVYQVDLLGHGKEAFLEAQPLTVVRDNKDIHRSGLALSGKFLAGCRSTESPDVDQLFLLEYATSKSYDMEIESESCICAIFQTTTHQWVSQMYMTPTDEIIVMSSEYIDIFSVRQLQSHTSQDGILLPLHHISCDAGIQFCTPPFTHQNFSSLIFGHEDQIHLARFPSSNDEAPIITKIQDQPLYMDSTNVIVGFTPVATLIIHSDTWNADLLSFSWDETPSLGPVAVVNKRVTMKLDDDFVHTAPCGVEKGIGRVVFYTPEIGTFVLDAI